MRFQKYVTVLFVMAFILLYANAVTAQSTDQPVSPVKLVFIHHSTGGHWLAEDNEYTYGELGKTLMNNNYYVSATNYCWGPIWEEQDENRGIGSYTNIVHWPEWFTGSNSSTILRELYDETGQNFENCEGDSFGSWPRFSSAPGGENEIIMFKSCYPNSDLYGNPEDPAASSPNGWEFNVSNGKAVYNNLLTYFQTRQDKLFIVITAPPMSERGYIMNDVSTPASERAANARAFTNWLVEDWLSGYSHNNIAVFNYYNVLTSNGGSTDTNDAGQETGNHHRWHNGKVQHIQTNSNNFSSYPVFVGSDYADDHPATAGHHKATAEFVPLLNYFYNKWKGTGPSVTKPTVNTGSAASITTSSSILHGTVNPNGESTTFHFEYGPSTSYGHSTTSTSAGSGSGAVSKSASITGLNASTIYHYRIVASNSGGTTYGSDKNFTTEGTTVSAPTVTTGSASSVTSSSARLSGTVNPSGDSTTFHFEYGPSTSYGHSTTSTSAGSGSGAVSKSASITGLSASTTYHYRIVASNTGGTTYGTDKTFTTSAGSSVVAGNIDGSSDGKVDLKDTIVALKICAGIKVSGVVLAADINNDNMIGMEEAVYAMQMAAGITPGGSTTGELVQPSDLQYLGAFRLPDDGERPDTFEYGGSAMTFNPNGDAGTSDGYPGSLFVMGHDRLPWGEMSDGNQVAEISIPAPVKSSDINSLNQAGFVKNFHDVMQGYFTNSQEIIRTGMQYLDNSATGPKIHVVWGCHFDLDPSEGGPLKTHAWFNPNLSSPNVKGTWFIGNQSFYSVTGYMFEIPASWADQHTNGRYLGTGRFRDGGWSGMGPVIIAYRPWTDNSGTPASPGTRLQETVLLHYKDSQTTGNIEQSLNNYQHPDEWEGVVWITSTTGKSAVLFAGTKGTGAKYWYGWVNPAGPEHPCVEEAFVNDFTVCRLADGTPCPATDLNECGGHNDYRGWWSSRFDAQFILYDPDDLAKVAAGEMNSWEPQPYATVDIDEHLFLNPANVEPGMLGTGVQRTRRIGPVTYDRNNDLMYVMEMFADEAKPVVHVWKVQ